ncbi:unnamed protein product, partial [Sphacelaria rigidula]
GVATGFFTGGGKSLRVSAEAMAKAERSFGEEANQFSVSSTSPVIAVNSSSKFCAARGTSVHTSKEALAKADKRLGAAVDGNNGDVGGKSWNSKGTATPAGAVPAKAPSGGFFAAKGTPVDVSEEALKRADALLGSAADKNSGSSTNDSGGTKERNKPAAATAASAPAESVSGGFVTAKGTPVHVSDEALAKATKLLGKATDENIGDGAGSRLKGTTSSAAVAPAVSAPGGFRTARGTPVHVSEEALAKATKLLGKATD